MVAVGLLVALLILPVILVLALVASAIKIIPPYETGIYIRLGRYVGVLKPGVNFVTPLLSTVVPVDMRIQGMAVTGRSMRFRDGQKIDGVTLIDYRFRDPAKAHFTVPDAKYALADMVEKTTRSVLGKSSLDEFDRNRDLLNERLTAAAKKDSLEFGVEIVSAEIREAGTSPLPFNMPFNRRHETPKGVLFLDTTDHDSPHKESIPGTYRAADPWKR